MPLTYDPEGGYGFWKAIRTLPGFPKDVEHPIEIMIFEPGAIYKIPDVLPAIGADNTHPLMVVMDQTEMRRGVESLKPLILDIVRRAGWEVQALVMQPDATGQVHTDMPHIEEVKRHLRPGMTVLSVGSGVVTDITKHACFLFKEETRKHIPFVVYQTANSVSAYTSNMAPVFIEGVKRTLPSIYPDALICDLETLRDAPHEMTVAGVGDLLAVYVSFPDWVLAHHLGMDSDYCELPARLMGPLDDIFMEEAEAIRSGSLEGMAILAKLISLGGLAMSLTHATTSMSGYEHVMSHILDLYAETSHQPLAQHGTQVAMAAILGAEAYRRFLAKFDPTAVNLDECFPEAETMHTRIREAFNTLDQSGKAGEECWSDYKHKLAKWHTHRPELEAMLLRWPEVKAEVETFTAPPERLIEILTAVGSPTRFADLVPPASEEHVRFAFLNAPLMRKRLTLGDLLIFFGWDREALWKDIWAKIQE